MAVNLSLSKLKEQTLDIKRQHDLEDIDEGDKNVIVGEEIENDNNMSWPLCTYLILFIEFCERFCFYGLKSILKLYFEDYFGMSKTLASECYHWYNVCTMLSPFLGSIIADSFWGRFKTIKYLSFVYIIGTVLLAVSAIPTMFLDVSGAERTIHKYLMIAGLFTIAMGSGGIKPCVAAFGADQFPVHAYRAKESYFKWFYFFINCGATISAYVTPVMKRWDCFPQYAANDTKIVELFADDAKQLAFDSCQVSAYGLSALLMFLAFCAFIMPPFIAAWAMKNEKKALQQKFTYIKAPLKEQNILKEVFIAICSGIYGKIFNKSKKEPVEDEGFLVYSTHRVGRVRRGAWQLCKMSLLFVPILFFWFVFDQMPTFWLDQHVDEDGWISFFGKIPGFILADQVEVLNSILVMTLIPIWVIFVGPFIDKIFYQDPKKLKRKPIHMLCVGYISTTLAAFIVWSIQIKVDSGLTFIDKGTDAHQAIFFMDDEIEPNFGDLTFYEQLGKTVYYLGEETNMNVLDKKNNKTYEYVLWKTDAEQAEAYKKNKTAKQDYSKKINYFYRKSDGSIDFKQFSGKRSNVQNKGPVIVHVYDNDIFTEDKYNRADFPEHREGKDKETTNKWLLTAKLGNETLKYENGRRLMVDTKGDLVSLIEPRKINYNIILWQYLALTFGEIMISTTCLEFCYTQAPPEMRTVILGLFYLSISFGDLFIIFMKKIFYELLQQGLRDFLLVGLFSIAIASVLMAVIGFSFPVMDTYEIEHMNRDDDDEDEQAKQTFLDQRI